MKLPDIHSLNDGTKLEKETGKSADISQVQDATRVVAGSALQKPPFIKIDATHRGHHRSASNGEIVDPFFG